jgi:hypothetical protein
MPLDIEQFFQSRHTQIHPTPFIKSIMGYALDAVGQ